MRLRSIFRSADDSWRTGWRIITMFVLLAAVIIGLNVAWKSLGLPGRQGSGPWGFLLFASLTGYGTTSLSSFAPASLAAALLPMLLAGFVLAAWEEFVLRGYLLRQLPDYQPQLRPVFCSCR